MPQNNIEKILIDAGLSKEQAYVYNSLIEKGPQKASMISKWTGIERTLVYKVLEQLKLIGLVSEKGGKGTVAMFSPNHPSSLMKSVEQKEQELKTTKELLFQNIGQLSSKFNLLSGKPNVQFFEGEEGMQTVLNDTLTSKESIYSYADLEAILKYIPKVNEEYSAKREKLKIKKLGLILDTEKSREIIKNYYTDVTETKFIKYKAPEFGAVMQIYDGKISYLTLKEGSMIGIIIEDKTIYEMHKSLFEYLWEITTLPTPVTQ